MARDIKYIAMDSNPILSDVVVARFPTIAQQHIDGIVGDMLFTHPLYGASTPVSTHVMSTTAITYASMATAAAAWVSAFATLGGNKLTDNFLKIRMTTPTDLGEPPTDIFDPNFDTVIANFGQVAKRAYESGFKGIMLDPESPVDPLNEWDWLNYNYRPYRTSKTPVEYRKEMRRRMAQVSAAIAANFPTCKLVVAIGWEQVIKQHRPMQVGDRYYLFPDLLAGLFDGKGSQMELIDFYEDSYSHTTQAQYDYDVSVVAGGPEFFNIKDADGYPYPATHKFKKASTIFLDYPASAVYDTSVLTNNFWTPTILEDTLVIANTTSDANLDGNQSKYIFFYAQDISFTAASPTVPAGITRALYQAKKRSKIERGVITTDYYDLVLDFDPAILNLANDARITTATDRLGNVFTEISAAKGPLFKTAGINGQPTMLFTAANSEALIGDAVAALLPTFQDWPFFISMVLQLTTAGGATFCPLHFGRNNVNGGLRLQVTSAGPAWACQRADDAGSSTIVSGGTANTSAHILSAISDGTHLTLYVDNAVVGTPYSAQNVGVTTFTQATFGAARANTNSQFFGGHVGRTIMGITQPGLNTMFDLNRKLANQYRIVVA